MSSLRVSVALRVSIILTFLALALMISSLIEPTPILVVIAMSVGQALGTLAFVLYLFVVVADLMRARVLFDVKRQQEKG